MNTDKTTENKIFGERITELRHKIGITQEQLSFRSEVNRTYMGSVERGEKTPSLHTIIKIAKGLNISLKELFDY
jgi:transcriptional regulator with XRE-family HTH domain